MEKYKLPADSKVRKHIDFVSLMNKNSKSPKKRQQLLAVATPGDIDACSELFLNFLQGKFQVPKENLHKLEKYKKQIRKVANKKTPRREKKILLGTQTGGFLPFLLPALAPLLASVFFK